MNVIIKSGKKNWSGKEFSELPAKIYSSFQDAVTAIESYHFYSFDSEKGEYGPCDKMQKIEFIPLRESKEKKLLAAGRVRW